MSENIPEVECDVAVIGGGIAGLSAAIAAMLEKNATNMALNEKL